MVKLPIEIDRLCDRGEQTLPESIGILPSPERGLDHRELVAAKARQRIARAQARTQAFRHRPQRRVAGRVPEKVVDALEIIQVHIKDADLARVAARKGQGLFQPVMEQPTVRQTRQQVVRGQE